MKPLLLVGLGGGLGAIARYTLGQWVQHLAPGWRFPAATFAVNVLGCLVAGLLAGAIEKHGGWSPEARLLVFTGLIGGFTTFSAFGLETVQLLRRGETAVAAANVLLSVIAGVGVLALALRAASGR